MHPEFAAVPKQTGTVEWIGVSSGRRQPISVMNEVQCDEQGIVGDHHTKRQVSLIQLEHLHVMSNLLGGKEVEPQELRRNLLVSGVNLLALIGLEFQIGEVRLKGTKTCPPCELMEQNLGTGGYLSMVGHGGIVADVMQPGRIQLGDSVKILSSTDE